MKVAVVVLSNDTIHTDFMICLNGLLMRSVNAGIQVMMINPRTSTPAIGRWDGVRKAFEAKVDYVLFIDSDQTFPLETLERLLSLKLPIVGPAICRRRPPFNLNAVENGLPIQIQQNDKGTRKVERLGTGIMLVRMDVFTKIPEPWFNASFDRDKKRWTTEDESFCDAARLAGYEIHVDVELSNHVGHIGQHIHTLIDVELWKRGAA